MATMFKKPKRNFRRKINTSDSENENDNESEPMDVDEMSQDSVSTEASADQSKSKDKKKKKKPKEKEPSATAVLSFGHEDEEETAEVFKVKKSSHSKRIIKQLKKEKKEKEEQLEKDRKEQRKAERAKSGKTDGKSDSEDEEKREQNLKKLREELRTLNGDEAEALESSEDESEAVAFRNRLARGEIPDAKTIHIIRKQRQLARDNQDFIALEENEESADKNASTSRLVRDDDHDKSDEDEEEGRVDFTVNTAARDRQRMRDNFMAVEHGSDDDNEKAEKNWEDQQIQKAVKQAPEVILQQHTNGAKSTAVTSRGPPDLSRYGPNLATPLPSLAPMSRTSDTSQITIESVRRRLEERLDTLDTVYRGHKMALDTAQHDIEEAQTSIASCKQNTEGLEERYRFFQEMRGYVRDLVECLNEKVPSINELEQRMQNLLRTRATRLLQRRQQDVRDQCQDYMTNKAAGQVVMATEEEQAKQRRVAEREARRSRRRRARETRNIVNHHEGLSSDDEESQADETKFCMEQENIEGASTSLFEDALEDFVEMDLIRRRFEEWKFEFGDTYREAYIALCIPKLVNPFVRMQLMGWNPLKEDCQDFEDMNWYNCLVFFGCESTQEVDPEDSDVKILPSIVEKVVIPKLTYLVESVWDPLSTTQTSRLVNLSQRIFKDYPTVSLKSKPTQAFLQAVVTRIKKALDDDVFMPLYPMSVLDNRSSGPATFFHRQSWTCIKLLGNILSWHGLVGTQLLQRLALDGLLNRYIVLGLANSHVDRHSMEKCQTIISTFPKIWFADLEGEKTLTQLENLCRFLSKAAELIHKSTCRLSDSERQEGRLLIKQMSKQLVTIHAMDHAVGLSNQYSFKINAS
ncbi:PAX3- and PAX7-binding protein 1-like isoform X2 [Littorina saxatilis]|uniref:GCF C-terminal domain-containing protein n=1 Tax=Littorina saxatilis TaxID=31220 RepID=A0AAN9BLW0_9CAEN